MAIKVVTFKANKYCYVMHDDELIGFILPSSGEIMLAVDKVAFDDEEWLALMRIGMKPALWYGQNPPPDPIGWPHPRHDVDIAGRYNRFRDLTDQVCGSCGSVKYDVVRKSEFAYRDMTIEVDYTLKCQDCHHEWHYVDLVAPGEDS
ncbi:MAG: hypothetical protein JNJ61_27115 [Anaerolineae bacterium]|nr:hypothetical protein [Anaerolineae bacterium]